MVGISMTDQNLAHRDASGNEYYREKVDGDERLVKKSKGYSWPVFGVVLATVVAFLAGSR